MLSGAGIVKGSNDVNGKKVYVHTVYDLVIEGTNYVEGSTNNDTTIPAVSAQLYAKLPKELRDGATLVATKEAPIYATTLDEAGAPKYFLSAISADEIYSGDKNPYATGAVSAEPAQNSKGVIQVGKDVDLYFKITVPQSVNYPDNPSTLIPAMPVKVGDAVRIDCYTVHGAGAQELEISADEFAGYYYIEADTLFREEATGQDLPAQFIIPRGKIQSNFTFTMANSGDPSESKMRMAA